MLHDKIGENDLQTKLLNDKTGENDLQMKLLNDKTGENEFSLKIVVWQNGTPHLPNCNVAALKYAIGQWC